jgi:hypothetical protein
LRFEETDMSNTLISRPALHLVPELLERCDSCGAAAKLYATIGASGELAFCGHHANRYVDRIVATADRVAVLSDFAWKGAEPRL